MGWVEEWEAAHKRKRAKYAVVEYREGGWSVRLYTIEVGATGFVGDSMMWVGLQRARLHKATREVA